MRQRPSGRDGPHILKQSWHVWRVALTDDVRPARKEQSPLAHERRQPGPEGEISFGAAVERRGLVGVRERSKGLVGLRAEALGTAGTAAGATLLGSNHGPRIASTAAAPFSEAAAGAAADEEAIREWSD